MKILSKTMNFETNYVNNTGRNNFGDVTPEGNYTGALNALENEEVDLGGNIRTIQLRKLVKSTSLYPVHPKGFSIIVPKRPYTLEVSYLDAIESSCGEALTVFMLLVFFLWIKLAHIYKRIKIHEEETDALRVMIIIFGSLLITSQPAPRFRHENCLMIAVLFCSVILSSTYQAKMVQHLTVSRKSADIKNVLELLKSDLQIIVPDALKSTISLESLSNKNHLTRKKTIIISSNHSKILNAIVTKKDTAYIISDLFCELIRAQLYDEKGKRYTHVIKNFITIPASLMTLKRSPYKHRFNQILLKLCEIGVMNKIFDDVYKEIDLLKYKRYLLLEEKKVFYTMEQLKFIFKAFCGCLGVCLLVFICEILMPRYQKVYVER